MKPHAAGTPFALQANPLVNPSFKFNQQNVIAQCDKLAGALASAGYRYCSLDSGWSVGDHGDEHGRILYDDTVFDIPALADHLHKQGLRLGSLRPPGSVHQGFE